MTSTTYKIQHAGHPNSIATAASVIYRTVQQWRSLARQRAHLARLTPGQLDDIGVSAEAAREEAAKPFWIS